MYSIKQKLPSSKRSELSSPDELALNEIETCER